MKNKANASAKSKEVQPNTKAVPQLHHICFFRRYVFHNR